MRAFLALIIFIAVVVILTIVWSSQHQTQTLPLVVASTVWAPPDHRPSIAAAPPCPKLSNPCDKIDCNRPNTKEIA